MKVPMLDKMQRVKTQSQSIGEFLEWLQSKDILFCQATGKDYHQYIPVGKSIEQWLADYFKIDLDKAEQERRKILAQLRHKGTLRSNTKRGHRGR